MKRIALLLLLALPLSARLRTVRTGPVQDPALWLAQHAITIDAFQPTDARVIVLGDVTHGTHETYAAKRALAPLLVANGFRIFAFEAPYSEMKALDDYVARGIGDPAEILNSPFYWFWDTDEILELVQWMRAQNVAGLTPPIRIAGLDPTSPTTTTANVVSFLRRVDPATADIAEANYACMLGPRYTGSETCKMLVNDVRAFIEANAAPYEALSSPSDVADATYAARVAEQEERIRVLGMNARDPYLAENILSLLSRGEKIVVFGHNEHFGHTPYVLRDTPQLQSAGGIVASTIGDDYFVIGTLVLEGTFNAVEYGAGGGVIRVENFDPPSADDFARLFDAAGLKTTSLVPLNEALPDALAGLHEMRFAASSVKSASDTCIEAQMDLGTKFDAVIYIPRSTPTIVRHFPTF